MSRAAQIVLIILTIIYVVSPIDFFPGPIDDIIVVLMSLATQKRIGQSN